MLHNKILESINVDARDITNNTENFVVLIYKDRNRPWIEPWTLPAYGLDKDCAMLARKINKWIKQSKIATPLNID